MSIWVDPHGEAYAGDGENAWLKYYADYLHGKTKKELEENAVLHYKGTDFRHRAEDVDYTEEETVAAALKREEEERTAAIFSLRGEMAQNVQGLVARTEEAVQQEADARAMEDGALLAKMQQLPVQSGEGDGSLKSLQAADASGENAVAIGKQVRAKSDCQWARGRYNLPDATGTYLDIVGNGNAGKLSNAYTLDKDGNAWFAGEVAVGLERKPLATLSDTRDTIVTEIDGENLCLEEKQDARLGETERLVLSMPENMTDWYKSTFSFQSGENATALTYAYAPLLWKGDDVTEDGRFIPEPFSTYEVDVKSLGENGVRARVDKVDGFSSVEVEGSVLSLPSSAGRKLRDYKIYGNSVQNGVPSAENPVVIQNVGDYNEETGKYDIPLVVQGKNLIEYPYMNTSTTVHGITFIDNGDGSIEVSGTATANATFAMYRNTENLPKGIIGGKDYTLSLNADKEMVEDVAFVINYYPAGTTSSSGYKGWLSVSSNAPSKVATAPEDIQGIYCYLSVASGKTVHGTVYPQLQYGKEVTSFENYVKPAITTISLDAPLRKVGDVADYVDYAQGVVVRAVAVQDESGELPIEESYLPHEQVLSEPIDLPSVDTYLYDNTLSADTTVQPDHVKVTYFKKKG